MTETPEAAHERKAIRWDGTVTAGNLLTAVAMVVALLTWGFRLEAANDRAQDRLTRLEAARERDDRDTAGLRESVAGMRADVSTIRQQTDRILTRLDGRAP
jgi:hypothetical protein